MIGCISRPGSGANTSEIDKEASCYKQLTVRIKPMFPTSTYHSRGACVKRNQFENVAFLSVFHLATFYIPKAAGGWMTEYGTPYCNQ
jgi:hypothetical protein